MLYLDVDFSEKDAVKQIGAKWAPNIGKWYVKKREDYPIFANWIVRRGNIILCDKIYLLQADYQCFHCDESTKVICIGFKEGFVMSEDESTGDIHMLHLENKFFITPSIDPLPRELNQIIKDYSYHYGYDEDMSAYRNYCMRCGMPHDERLLFSSISGPFPGKSIEKKIIEEFPLYTDFQTDAIAVFDI